MQGIRQLRSVLLVAVIAALTVSCFAQTSNDATLTNAEVVKMVKAGLPESVILREIQMSRTQFATTPAALIQLKKQGASESILNAVLDTQGGGGYASQQYANDPTAQSKASHQHRMPSIQADLRLNSKKHEKVTVGQNHVELRQSGVPIFSLKWKDPDSGK
jgi:hypothetical protein